MIRAFLKVGGRSCAENAHFTFFPGELMGTFLFFFPKNSAQTSIFPTPSRKELKEGLAENPSIVFLIEYDGDNKISRKDKKSLNISFAVLCAFAWYRRYRVSRSR